MFFRDPSQSNYFNTNLHAIMACYESIHFFLLCTTGKISISTGGEIKKFCPFLKPSLNAEEKHHWKYCTFFSSFMYSSHLNIAFTVV